MANSVRARKLSKDGIRGLVILVCTGVGLIAMGAAPFIWRQALDSQLAESRDNLQLLTRRVGAGPKQMTPLDPASASTVFTKGETSGLANAELQRLLVDTAEKTGMVIARTRPLPSEPKGGVVILRMEVNGSGKIEQLQQYLHQIETGVPLVFVKKAHVATGPAGSENDAPEMLDVRLELEAFAWLENAT